MLYVMTWKLRLLTLDHVTALLIAYHLLFKGNIFEQFLISLASQV